MVDDIPHQLKIAQELTLVVVPGSAPLCLQCKSTSHIRRDCQVHRCSRCRRFGHEEDDCAKTYASVTGRAQESDAVEHLLDEAYSEETAGVGPNSAVQDGPSCCQEEGVCEAPAKHEAGLPYEGVGECHEKVDTSSTADTQITPELVRNAKNELDELARNKIGSYGLLNVIRKPSELKDVVQAMKPVIEVLKELQGSDDDRRTVIAIGSYDYGDLGFLNTYRDIFKDIIDTFKADAAIAISSVSSMEDQAGCYAAPPNVFKSNRSKFPSLATHWPLVRFNETYADGKMLRGLSFEMGTLVYVLQEGVRSLRAAAYARCTDFIMTSRDAICGKRQFVDASTQFLGEPYDIYATFLEDDVYNYVAFAEYHTSALEKFVTARRKYGSLHHRSAWLLFNVHLGDVRPKCGADAFSVVKWFCQYYKGTDSCGP
ncbi:uncharacterized protein LOC142803136 [Rhipicephalus microplus]|uniref:uncharacterized protein LOC142803136 n=1 Tax=Rhipicephalus microplus TaxID=6941 RepID=UPI003F6B3A33